MEYCQLGREGPSVPRMILGTAIRSGVDEKRFLAAIDAALEMGCNFLDTANIYQDGTSERIAGLAAKGRRDKFFISSKVGARPIDGTELGGGPAAGGLAAKSIYSNIEKSLKRVDTDYLDCYLCHFPDPETPLEETLEAMGSLVKQGKIRFYGCSNFESWRLSEVLTVCRDNDYALPICDQVNYSMLSRQQEHEVMPYCKLRGIGVTVYGTTGIGFLSGRYRYGQPPPKGTSWYRGPYNYRKSMTPKTGEIIDTVVAIALEHGITPSQVAMAWCLAQGVDCVITGADTPERVQENMRAVDVTLSAADIRQLSDITSGYNFVGSKDCPEGYKEDEDK